MKPLERAQLKNWKEYIDFEIENGSHERVVVLFERCMVACALYEEFWIKVRGNKYSIHTIHLLEANILEREKLKV